ncbi:hypothetical protein EMPS_07521 [Entomortierella parvispora]|uniref:F-box domain-containing protein n=1 Tax=Entomortierella parvispora TaxID=205924 RepID=A0A9P3HEQ2_9FUNG|nr:hypothetical protein EMPS_07521 [Entomortierella parvispora]
MVFKTHPLDLHEIRSRIATQLDVMGLAACALVCRDWNASFTPRLYRTIALSCFGPSVDSFRKNGHFVHHLDVHDTADVELFHVQGLDKLTTVRFVDSMDYRPGDGYGHNDKLGWGVGEEISGRFLYNNSHSLKSIHIAQEIASSKFWDVLRSYASVPKLVDGLPQNCDDLVLVPEEETGGYGRGGLQGYGYGGATDFFPPPRCIGIDSGAPAEITMQPLPMLLQSCSRLQHQYQPQQQETEVLLEMPPPKLINRRKRKLKGSSSLNEKYSHMKYEMELLSQDPLDHISPSPYSHRNQFQAPQHPLYVGAGHESVVPDATGTYSGWNPTTVALDVNYIDPVQESWEQDTSRCGSLIPPTNNCNNNVLSGGPYSTPHFRLLPSTPVGYTIGGSPLPVHVLPYLNSSPPLESAARYLDPISLKADEGLEEPLNEVQFDEDLVPRESVTDDSNTTGHSYLMGINHKRFSPSSNVLSRQPLTLRDRIHRLGHEMRTSAATSVSKFSSPIPLPPRSPSVSKRLSQSLDTALAKRSVHEKTTNVKDKSKPVELEEKAAPETGKGQQSNLQDESLKLQRQRQLKRFQSSVRSGILWTNPCGPTNLTDR